MQVSPSTTPSLRTCACRCTNAKSTFQLLRSRLGSMFRKAGHFDLPSSHEALGGKFVQFVYFFAGRVFHGKAQPVGTRGIVKPIFKILVVSPICFIMILISAIVVDGSQTLANLLEGLSTTDEGFRTITASRVTCSHIWMIFLGSFDKSSLDLIPVG